MFRFRSCGSFSAPAPRKTRCGRFCLVVACLFAGLTPLQAQTTDPIEREFNAGAKSLEAEKFDDSITHFDRIIPKLQDSKAPHAIENLALALRYRADAHYSAEHWKLAIADYDSYLKLKPNDAEAFSLRGVARKATGDYDGLMADSKRAAEIDPQYDFYVDAAQSTILRRRGFLALWVIGCLVLAAGAIPFFKAIKNVASMDAQARKSRQESNTGSTVEQQDTSEPKLQ